MEQIVVVNWLENFKKDILKFLEALDVVNCSEIASKTVEAIIKLVFYVITLCKNNYKIVFNAPLLLNYTMY